MNRSFLGLAGTALWAVVLAGCTPIGLQEQSPQEREQAYERERYQARIRSDPFAPQATTGFWRLGRVYSATIVPDEVARAAGSPRDLDLILDSVNELTNIEAEFAPSIPYGHPGLFELPIIVPQSTPNETEMEQLSRYLQGGGFCLLTDLDFDIFREALEKHGGLVWGRDMWVERLPEDHPLFAAFFDIKGGMPLLGGGRAIPGDPAQQLAAQQRLQGFFVEERLAALHIGPLGTRVPLPGTTVSIPRATRAGTPAPVEQPLEDLDQSPAGPAVNFRLQQLLVNIVLYVLTDEGSIAQSSPGR